MRSRFATRTSVIALVATLCLLPADGFLSSPNAFTILGPRCAEPAAGIIALSAGSDELGGAMEGGEEQEEEEEEEGENLWITEQQLKALRRESETRRRQKTLQKISYADDIIERIDAQLDETEFVELLSIARDIKQVYTVAKDLAFSFGAALVQVKGYRCVLYRPKPDGTGFRLRTSKRIEFRPRPRSIRNAVGKIIVGKAQLMREYEEEQEKEARQ